MEVHKAQFRGAWIPVEILDQFHSKTINATEMVLLVTIDSLVHPKRGCYASNEYLAGQVQTTPDHVQRMLRKLVGLGLVFRTIDKNVRALTTVWSRITIEKPPSGGYEGRGVAFLPGGDGICATQSITENKYTEAAAPEVPSADVGKAKTTMGYVGFTATTPKETKGSPLPHQESWAAALRQSIYDKGRGVTRWSKRSWANEFRKLQDTDGVSAERISEVLAWYGKHMGGEYIPQAYCAEAFRRKFVAIEGAMQRQQAAVKVYTPVGDTKAIYDEVRTLAWPNGCSKDLPKLIMESHANYATWYAKFKRLAAGQGIDSLPNTLRTSLVKFAEHVKLEVCHPTKFIKWWVLEVQRKIVAWEGWEGTLPHYVWYAGHPMFSKAGAKWSKEWDGQTKWWSLLYSAIEDMK